MNDSDDLDSLFREAISALDAGDIGALGRLLSVYPELVRERLENPGAWLRDLVDGALEGYFRAPYLLWFIAENPIRNDKLPANILDLTRLIITVAARDAAESLPEQLDYTLGLVVTGRVPRECGVQLELIDLLIDAGAKPGRGHGALGGGNLAAAERLIERGGELTLAVALCLDREDDVRRLAPLATAEDRQVALAAAALNGRVAALTTLIALGVDINAYSTGIHPHATALHHAVSSGSLDAVKVLVEAGADLTIRDRIYDGTPLDWAEYLKEPEIAAWLRERQGGAKMQS
jgi:peptide-methionine (S)-S-oxide reductase